MPGYFDPTNYKRNRELYPNIAALDDKVAKMLHTDEAKGWSKPKREVETCRIHPIYWLEHYGWIRQGELVGGAEEVGIVPFKLNTVQLQIANRICKAFLEKPWKRVQIIVLKHRKAGISTLCAGFDYWLSRFVRNLNGFVIADLGGHTDNIMSMIQLFHERDTCGNIEDLHPKDRPPLKKPMPKNKKGLKFSNESMLEQDSGENSNPGTSGTINLLHMSENSKWRDPDNAETSLLNSVPRKGFAFIIKESTAFGINKYAKDWEDAESGKSNWEAVFITWRDLPDCEYELELGEVVEYTDKERELASSYNLRPGHVKYRRSQIELLGSEDKFRQDFPLNSKEPFLMSGFNFFNTLLVQERIMEIKFFRDWKLHGWDYVVANYPEIVNKALHHPQGLRSALNVIEDRNVVPREVNLVMNHGVVTTVPAPQGGGDDSVSMFKAVQRNKMYLVIVDVAEGIHTSEYVSDNSVVRVLDVLMREEVAVWGGNFDEEVTAMYAVLLARYYNNADIVPEMNNKCGGTLKSELDKLGYRKFFMRQKVTGTGQVTRDFGWETTVGNKKEICGQFRLDFKNQMCLIHSLPLLEEMLDFVDAKGKLQASSGTDDHVMTMSIGLKIINDTPMYHQPTRTPRRDIEEPSMLGSTYPLGMGNLIAQDNSRRRREEKLAKYM